MPFREFVLWFGSLACFCGLGYYAKGVLTNKRWRPQAAALDADFSPERFLRSRVEINGRHRNVMVHIATQWRGRGKHRTRYIRYQLRLPTDCPSFTIKKRGLASTGARKLAPSKGERFGSHEFDDLVTVSAGHREAARAHLNSRRQAAVINLFRGYKNVELTQSRYAAEVRYNGEAVRSIATTTRRLVGEALVTWGEGERLP